MIIHPHPITERAEGERSLIYPSPSLLYFMTAPPQHKQRYYYIFWSIATLSVVIGQICVVNTYNRLSDNLEYIIIEQAREKTAETSI